MSINKTYHSEKLIPNCFKMAGIDIFDGKGFPLLNLIGEYSGNTYSLYVVFEINDINRFLKSFSDEELVSKAENKDFQNNNRSIVDLCCKYGNLKALKNSLRASSVSK